MARQQELMRQSHLDMGRVQDGVIGTDAPLERMESMAQWLMGKIWGAPNAQHTHQRRAQRFERDLENRVDDALAHQVKPLQPEAVGMAALISEETPLLRQYVQQQDAELEQARLLLHDLKRCGLNLRVQLDADKERLEVMRDQPDQAVAHMVKNMSIMDRLIAQWSALW